MGRLEPAGRHRQPGQAVVLVAIAVLLLTAILALALDGGTIYLDRRQIQNAADAAALAGAEDLQVLPYPNYSGAHTQAMITLVKNLPGTSVPVGFSPTASQTTVDNGAGGGLSIGAGYQVTLTVATTYTYQVTVWHAHTVAVAPIHGFASTITLKAQAVAQNANLPFAAVLLQDQNPSVANFSLTGTAAVTLKGGGGSADRGGMFSNASLNPGAGTVTFSPCAGAGDLWAVSETAADDASTVAATTCRQTGGSPYPRPIGHIGYPAFPEPPPPAFTAVSGATVAAGPAVYLCPGQYLSAITIAAGGTAVLLPGVYRVEAGGIGVTGTLRTLNAGLDTFPIAAGSTNCGQTVSAMPADPGVILELTPGNAAGFNTCALNQFVTASGSSVTLAPSPRFFNVSLFVETLPSWLTTCTAAPLGTNVVRLSGGGYYSIPGALFGPYDNMQIASGAAGSGAGQVIAWTLTVPGSGAVSLTYNPSRVPYMKGLVL